MQISNALLAVALAMAMTPAAQGAAAPHATAAPALQKRVFPTGSSDVSAFLETVKPSELSKYFSWAGKGDDSFTTHAESFVSNNAEQISQYFKSHSLDAASASADVGNFGAAAAGGAAAIGAGAAAGSGSGAASGSGSTTGSSASATSSASGASSTGGSQSSASDAASSAASGAQGASSTAASGAASVSSAAAAAATSARSGSNGAAGSTANTAGAFLAVAAAVAILGF